MDDKHSTHSNTSGLIAYWHRIPIWTRAIVVGVLVSSIGVYGWLLVGALVPAPWSILLMGALLWVYAKYFRGSWWPLSTSELRSTRFRSIKMSMAAWRWSLLCALLIVVIWQSSLVVTFRLVEFPADLLTAGYDIGGMPIWTAWLMIIMSALVAGICEETGFRGYMQIPLENRYGPVTAIGLVSFLFLVVHFQQVWTPPLLIHLFALSVLLGILAHFSGSLIPGMVAHFGLDIFNFSYWWTDLTGRYNYRPIKETGIDVHFLLWGLLLALSAALFYWTIRKIMAARRSE